MVRVRQASFNLLLILLSSVALTQPCAARANSWVSVRSENFALVGHVGERELLSLANNLEEFRAVFSQLLPEEYFDTRWPMVIVVFADGADYAPFKPLREGQPDQSVAGYFKAGHDLSYITLAAGGTHELTTSVLFHEYVHSLVRNRYGRAPLWLDEGVAEYYSAYELADGKRQEARVGKQLPRRVQYLRTHALLPLSSLLSAERNSPLYNDHDKHGIFYAQSWALVHYLMSDHTGERQRQLTQFLTLTSNGTPVDDSVRQAFQVEPAMLERRLAAYVRARKYPERLMSLAEPPQPSPSAEVRLLSEAETQAQLGDLLLHTDRSDEAGAYLQRALALDPNLAAARISLGLLYLREGRLTEAKEQFQWAAAAAPMNHLAHYYYADLLRRDGSDAAPTVAGYVARTNLIRVEIKRAIELAPDFLDAYGLLVLTDIERSLQLDEATELLDRLMRQAPGRRDFKLLLAQLNLRKEAFDAARAQLQSLVNDRQGDALLRIEAQTTLDSVPTKEKIAAARKLAGEPAIGSPKGAWQPCDMPEPGPQFKSLRFAGEQACGQLIKVECAGADVLIFVKAGERVLRLHTAILGRVKFVTYTTDVRGKIECGERPEPESVLVTYRPVRGDNQMSDGEVTAVEFVPKDWLHY